MASWLGELRPSGWRLHLRYRLAEGLLDRSWHPVTARMGFGEAAPEIPSSQAEATQRVGQRAPSRRGTSGEGAARERRRRQGAGYEPEDELLRPLPTEGVEECPSSSSRAWPQPAGIATAAAPGSLPSRRTAPRSSSGSCRSSPGGWLPRDEARRSHRLFPSSATARRIVVLVGSSIVLSFARTAESGPVAPSSSDAT